MRKPIHLQMIGGKAPRQLIWENIRALRQFSLPQLYGELSGGIDKDTSRTYINCLVNGDFLSVEQLDATQRLYTLEKDNGVEAPQLRKDGTLVTQGRPQESLWRNLAHAEKTPERVRTGGLCRHRCVSGGRQLR